MSLTKGTRSYRFSPAGCGGADPSVALLRFGAHAQNQPSALTTTPKKTEFVPGEVLVRFRPDETMAKTKGRIQLSMVSSGRSLRVEINSFGGSDLVQGLRLARVSPEATLDAIKALRARPDVLYAEPNYIRHFDAVPNDTFYGALNLELYVGETPAAVTINLTDVNKGVHNLPAEDVRPIPGGLGFTQVTFRLPNNLPAGTCLVKIVAHNLTSNVGAMRIAQ